MARSKGRGSVTLRKDGYYYGRVTYNGIYKEFYGKSEKEVQDCIDDFVITCKYANLSSGNLIKFSDYVMNYLYTYKFGFIKNSSFDRLESILNCQVKDTMVDIPVYKLNDVLLQQFLNGKSREVSYSTLKKIYDLIRPVLNYAYRRKDIDIDYGSLLVLPKSDKPVKRIQVYDDSDVDVLCDSIKRILSNPTKKESHLFRYAPAYILMLNTGLRAGEMLALTWDNVNLEKSYIDVNSSLSHIKNRGDDGRKYVDVITSTKTGNSSRRIPVNKTAIECLFYLKGDTQGPYVVHNLSGDNMKLRSFQQTFWRICEYVGVPNYGLHSLRHTFASRLISRGVPPKVVSQLLGHSSVIFTLNRYVHTYDDDLQSAVSSLDSSEKCV